jgi:hypothetical protein
MRGGRAGGKFSGAVVHALEQTSRLIGVAGAAS